jgi:protein-L-isoaspartate(D-aspartate) O-methyltransferase
MMEDEIEKEKARKLINSLYERNIMHDPAVAEVFEKISMKNFFPKEVGGLLYEDHPLPYCFDPQRPCAAPHMNAIFLHLINLEPKSKILQLSSMSGYFASLMSEISYDGRVKIIEDNKIIADITKGNIMRINLDNRIEVINGDPIDEISNFLDFDRIIFCGAISNSFLSKVAQEVKDGTIIIAPVYESELFPIDQDLIRIIKENGEIITESFGKVNFILLESEKALKWTEKTQKLIFDQIANQLHDYFQKTYPNQEPIFKLSIKTPEFISKQLLEASSMLGKGQDKQVILNCIEILKETIRYLYKKNVDQNVNFTEVSMADMIDALKKIDIVNEYNEKNLINVLDTEQAMVYDPENPPNFKYLSKNTLNHLIWFVEYVFK